jgi:hypothetical protein
MIHEGMLMSLDYEYRRSLLLAEAEKEAQVQEVKRVLATPRRKTIVSAVWGSRSQARARTIAPGKLIAITIH